MELIERLRREHSKGFTLIEILIAITLLVLIAFAGVTLYQRVLNKGEATGIIEFVNKVNKQWLILQHDPWCPSPRNKVEFVNEVSDSQCRTDTTDNKGNWIPPQKVAGKWNWDIQNGKLIIEDVAQSIAEKVIKVFPSCEYQNGNIECPLAESATATTGG